MASGQSGECCICLLSSFKEQVQACPICQTSTAHLSCAINEKLIRKISKGTRRQFFCQDCENDFGMEIEEWIVEEEKKFEEMADAIRKQEDDAIIRSQEEAENLRAQEEANKMAALRDSEKRFNDNEFISIEEVKKLNLFDEHSNERTQSNTITNPQLELGKWQKFVADLEKQILEVEQGGNDPTHLRVRLDQAKTRVIALSDLVHRQLMKQLATQTAMTQKLQAQAVEKQSLPPRSLPSQNKSNAPVWQLRNLNNLNIRSNCAVCTRMVQPLEDILKCRSCTVVAHERCGLGYLTSTGQSLEEIGPDDKITFMCERCVGNKKQQDQAMLKALLEKRKHMQRSSTQLNIPIQSMQNDYNASMPLHNGNAACYPGMADVNQRLIEMAEEKLRKERKALPLVTNEGLSWRQFYAAYQDTKNLFSPYTNAQRIQQAIKCAAVKEKGGDNLFDQHTCDDTVEFLNEIYADTTAHMLKELQSVLAIKSPLGYDYVALENFLIKAKNFAVMQNSFGNDHAGRQYEWMTRITDKLPFEYKQEWQKFCFTKQQARLSENFHDLENFLKEKIHYVNKLKKDHLFLTPNQNASDKQHRQATTSNRNNNKFNNTQKAKGAWDYKCWVCQSDEHYVRDCQTAKEKDGKEILGMAIKLKLCILCGNEEYVRGKACTGSRKPNECRRCPGKKHWATLCPLRRGTKSSDKVTSQKPNRDRPNANSTGRSDFNNSQAVADKSSTKAIEYPERPMIMAANNQTSNRNRENAQQWSNDDGAEYLAQANYHDDNSSSTGAIPRTYSGRSQMHQGNLYNKNDA